MIESKIRRRLDSAFKKFEIAADRLRVEKMGSAYTLFKKCDGNLEKISKELGITKKTALDWYRSARISKGEI